MDTRGGEEMNQIEIVSGFLNVLGEQKKLLKHSTINLLIKCVNELIAEEERPFIAAIVAASHPTSPGNQWPVKIGDTARNHQRRSDARIQRMVPNRGAGYAPCILTTARYRH